MLSAENARPPVAVPARVVRATWALLTVLTVASVVGTSISPLLLAMPFLSVCVLAGASRTRFIVFLPALIAGHFIWVFTTIWLGTRFAAQAQAVVDFFSDRLFASTLVCVALVAAYQLITRRRAAPP